VIDTKDPEQAFFRACFYSVCILRKLPFSVSLARHFWKCIIKIRAAGWPGSNSAAPLFARKSKALVVVFGLGRFPKQKSSSPSFLFFLYLISSFFFFSSR
jgi:hypothetical protein